MQPLDTFMPRLETIWSKLRSNSILVNSLTARPFPDQCLAETCSLSLLLSRRFYGDVCEMHD